MIIHTTKPRNTNIILLKIKLYTDRWFFGSLGGLREELAVVAAPAGAIAEPPRVSRITHSLHPTPHAEPQGFRNIDVEVLSACHVSMCSTCVVRWLWPHSVPRLANKKKQQSMHNIFVEDRTYIFRI